VPSVASKRNLNLNYFLLFSYRVLAIVSVDGGPTREALDSVFGLLKGNVQCEEEDEMMDNDEVRNCVP
jgi:hypothetical protein